MKQPHIIIINPDEMRADSIGHLGAPVPVTPHLDTFAQNEAVSFSNAFCQNPVCVPSRCSFFTGLYPHVHGHRTMTHLLHEHESSLFSELKNAGYYVWMNSRNDLIAGQIDGLDEKHADEVYYYDKTKPAPPMPIPDPSRLAAMGRGKQAPFPYLHFKGAGPEYKNIDLEDTLAACDRILHPVQPEKPLCLFLGWTNPHPPYMVPQEYRDRVNAAALAPRIKYSETQNKSRIIGSLRELTDGCNFPEEQWTELRAVYQAQCAMVDDMFGMVGSAIGGFVMGILLHIGGFVSGMEIQTPTALMTIRISAGIVPLIAIIVICVLMRAYTLDKDLPKLHAQMAAEAEH